MLLFILPFITFVRNVVEVRSTSILFPSFNIKASKYENHAIYRNRLRAVFGGKPAGCAGAGFREKIQGLYGLQFPSRHAVAVGRESHDRRLPI